MFTEYTKFYRKHGVRRPGHLTSPPITDFTKLKLPRASSIHFPQFNDDNFEIPQNHFLAEDIKRYMFNQVVENYADETPLGVFRFNPVRPLLLTRPYFKSNRRIRRYDVFSPVYDERTIVFHTYGLLNKRYIYLAKKRDTELSRWKNHWDTVISNLNKEAVQGIRKQFIVIEVPKKIPALTKLKRQEPLNIRTLRHFKNPDSWMVNSLWNFFSGLEEEYAYIFRNLSEEAMGNVNIIWKSNNVCTITNVDILRSFNTTFNARGKYDSFRFNKYLLNLFLLLNEATEPSNLEEPEDKEEDEDNRYDSIDYDDSTTDDEFDTDLDKLFEDIDDSEITEKEWVNREKSRDTYTSLQSVEKDATQSGKVTKLTTDTEVEEIIDEEDEYEDALIDQRLASLEFIDEDEDEITAEELAYTTYTPETLATVEYDQVVINAATEQARNGNITAGELRLATKRSETYKTLKDPRNPKKLFIDSLTVTEEDIKLDGDTQVANEVTRALVPDETMHYSSLKQFDRKYVNEVMAKHVSKTVMEVAKAGVSIQDYDIERVRNINDDFDIHSVRLTTIAGKQSTLRFRMPVVDENGQFKVGGVKSKMRKQWADKY